MQILFLQKLYKLTVTPGMDGTFSIDENKLTIEIDFKNHDPFFGIWHGLTSTMAYAAAKKHPGEGPHVQRTVIAAMIADTLRENPDLRSPDAFKAALKKSSATH